MAKKKAAAEAVAAANAVEEAESTIVELRERNPSVSEEAEQAAAQPPVEPVPAVVEEPEPVTAG